MIRIILLCLALSFPLYGGGERPAKTAAEAPSAKTLAQQLRIIDRGSIFPDITPPVLKRLPRQHQEWVIDTPEMQEYVSEFFGYVIPSVDFNNDVILFLFQGIKSTGGYAIRIQRVDTQDTRILIHVILEEPGDSCSTIQSITTPYEVALFPKTDKKVLFIPQIKTVHCQ